MAFCSISSLIFRKKHFVDVNQSHVTAPVNGTSSSGLSQDIIEQIQRPSVDSLLDELSNARSASPVYAVPHESADGKPKSGRHVTITVRETTTERVSGSPSQCKYKINLKENVKIVNYCSGITVCITLRGSKFLRV